MEIEEVAQWDAAASPGSMPMCMEIRVAASKSTGRHSGPELERSCRLLSLQAEWRSCRQLSVWWAEMFEGCCADESYGDCLEDVLNKGCN